METAHDQALSTLKQNRELLETIAMHLLETESIEGETLHHLLKQSQATSYVEV